MKVDFNKLDRGYKKYKEEYDKAVINVLESGHYIMGNELERFENNFKSYIGSKFCVGLNSGLDALILAFRALGIGEGDEVIVPANTYIASIIGVTANGAKPIFVEPDEYYNIDTSKIERVITQKTKAILAVHLYGQAATMSKISEIADSNQLYLVEDCAQSHGAKYKDKTTGTWGHVGCFSFYPTKNLGAFGDSGAILTDSLEIYDKIKMLRNYGSKIKYENELIGVNSRLDEIQASLLNVKLSHYNEIRKERIDLAEIYLKNINNPKLVLPEIRDGAEATWHLFVVRVDNREEFREYLSEKGVGSQIHYPIPPHLSKAYKYLGHKPGDFTITERLSEHIVSLPLYEGMTKDEVMYVVDVVNNY